MRCLEPTLETKIPALVLFWLTPPPRGSRHDAAVTRSRPLDPAEFVSVRCPRFLTRSVRTATPPHLSFDYRFKTPAPLRCRAGRATSTPAGDDGRLGPLKPRAPSRCESISGTSQSALWACIYILTSTSSLSLLAPPARRRRRDVGPPRASARKSFIVDDTGWNNESAT